MSNSVIENFCCKEGYVPNLNPEYYLDETDGIIYQPDVYELAWHIAKRSECNYIIDIGSGNGEKLHRFDTDYKCIAIDFGANKDLVIKNVRLHSFIETNLEEGLPYIDEACLKDSIVIMSDVIEHIINPDKVLKDLKKIAEHSKMLIISTPDRMRSRGIGDYGPPINRSHVREWTIEEFDALLKKYKFSNYMIGYTINNNINLEKSTIIALMGNFIYRESDAHLDTKDENEKCDWVIRCDRDSSIETPWDGVLLKSALLFVDRLGYTRVDFTQVNYRDGINLGKFIIAEKREKASCYKENAMCDKVFPINFIEKKFAAKNVDIPESLLKNIHAEYLVELITGKSDYNMSERK